MFRQTPANVVPTGAQPDDAIEFQAFYRGQPLPKAKVKVTTPPAGGQSVQTNASRKFSTALPWSGPYVLELMHRDDTPGQRSATNQYDRASYVTSLTVYQPTGIAPLPAAPAAKPNK